MLVEFKSTPRMWLLAFSYKLMPFFISIKHFCGTMGDVDNDNNQPSACCGIPKMCNPESWDRNIAKNWRNLEKEYTSVHSCKIVKTGCIGPPCSHGCFDKISAIVSESLFKLWEVGDYILQNTYITKHIHVVWVMQCRKPLILPIKNSISTICSVQWLSGYNKHRVQQGIPEFIWNW